MSDDRHRAGEQISAAAREGLPQVLRGWAAPVRREVEKLLAAALDPGTSDADFLELVEKSAEDAPGLLAGMPLDSLAGPLADAMGAAAANGLSARPAPPDP